MARTIIHSTMTEVVEPYSQNSLYERQLELCNARIEATNDNIIEQAGAYHDRGKLHFQYELYLQALQDYLAARRRYQMDPPGSHNAEMAELIVEIAAAVDWVNAGFTKGGVITLGRSSEASSG